MQSSVVQSKYIGQVLGGKYRVDGEIGQGGFGVVYKATHLGLGKTRAVKILRQLGEDWRRRFELEGRALAELNHPYVVAVVDVGVTDEGSPYLVMEYVEGTPLGRLIRGDGKLSLPRTLSIMRCVCSAVHYAHERGIIHRDLKPSNIIVQPLSGEGEIAKVLDFGLAKFMQYSTEDTPTEPLTQSGILLGTMEYMSPEQCAGKKADERSDIYALGVILYQMLTGNVPFTGDSPLAIISQHVNIQAPSVREVCPDLPGSVEWVISRALRKDPTERPQTALQLRQQLETAISHPEQISVSKTEEIRLTGTSLAKDLFFRWRRLLLKPKVIAAVVLVVGALSALSILQGDRPNRPQPWVINDPAGWRDQFPLTPDSRPLVRLWNAPPEWSVGPGELEGALFVQGGGIGIILPPGPDMALYDFSLRFQVTHVKGSQIAWVLRYQGVNQYYHFVLTLPKNVKENAELQGYVVSPDYDRPRPFPVPKTFPEFLPSKEAYQYWVEITASGSTFNYTITQERAEADTSEYTVQMEPDVQGPKYEYGTIGFGGLTDESTFRIEYVLLDTPQAKANPPK
jgi:serine/threonine protein kinase